MSRRFHYEFAAIVLSATVHATPLITLINGSNAPAPASHKPSPLKLAMFQPPPAPAEPQPIVEKVPEPVVEQRPKPVEKPKPKPKPKQKPKPVVQSPPPEEKPPEPEPVIQPKPVVTPPVASAPPRDIAYQDPGLIARIEDQYKYQLSKLIDAHKHYPKRAQRRNQQGKAKVSFIIMPDGAVAQVKLIGSSGYAVLDKAAIKAIQAISGKLPFPSEIKRRRWQFNIPVGFELS